VQKLGSSLTVALARTRATVVVVVGLVVVVGGGTVVVDVVVLEVDVVVGGTVVVVVDVLIVVTGALVTVVVRTGGAGLAARDAPTLAKPVTTKTRHTSAKPTRPADTIAARALRCRARARMPSPKPFTSPPSAGPRAT
jgi:hypothetical protein